MHRPFPRRTLVPGDYTPRTLRADETLQNLAGIALKSASRLSDGTNRRSFSVSYMSLTSRSIAVSALVILLSVGVLSFRSTLRDEEDRDWVTHTHVVLENLEQILTDITQAEASQRGYILTGDEEYLKTFDNCVEKVGQGVTEFRRLTSDNPRQQEAIKQLEPAIAARLAGLRERIEIRRRSGLAAASKAVATGDHSEQLMAEIRERIGGMRKTEQQLLVARLTAAADSAWKMKAIIVAGNLLAVVFLLCAGLVIHRETGRSNLAEQDLIHANELLKRQTLELSETNNELESFSYSVAHDLRAPLRQIGGYSKVLLQEHGPRLNGEAQRYLEKVADGARKMGRLVDDLLSLSKIGRQEVVLQATPLDALLRQVVEELAPECSGREVEWRIGELFNAECDPGLMKQVFVNLLSNAVKYTGRRERAVIEVGLMWQNDQRVVFVRDNGVGFEMQYMGKLFGVFQRLHKARDFEGTGVGLAIVQRIIRKHGGRIWAEAKLDEGAAFFFTLGSPGNEARKKTERPIKDEVINVA
jgi:signal transduction histidine kinase